MIGKSTRNLYGRAATVFFTLVYFQMFSATFPIIYHEFIVPQ